MRVAVLALVLTQLLNAQKPRARDLGVPFNGTPGARNAITDVSGVEVGYSTIVTGDSVRSGVTAIWPLGKGRQFEPVFAGWFSQNGNGEMTGTAWIEESGHLEGPVLITNTNSVGVVRDSYVAWNLEQARKAGRSIDFVWSLPVVAETWDGYLNDINSFVVKPEHTRQALESARSGVVAEGNVGGGTGMVCFEFKGGSGTASRIAGSHTVGVFVQCNCGRRRQLMVAGVPVGQEIPEARLRAQADRELGSIIIVVATDAPLLPHQLKRLARRATMGLARLGAISGNGSGDLFVAFSTANAGQPAKLDSWPNDKMDPIFEAVVDATEEAIVNSMVGADTTTGYQGHTVIALPHDKLRGALKKYNRP